MVGSENGGKCWNSYKILVILISSGDNSSGGIMYNMMTIDTNSVPYTRKQQWMCIIKLITTTTHKMITMWNEDCITMVEPMSPAHISCIVSRFFTVDSPGKPQSLPNVCVYQIILFFVICQLYLNQAEKI